MKNWLLKLPIRSKLLIAFGSILIMSVLLFAVGIATINRIIDFNTLVEKTTEINASTLKMASHLQEFADLGFKEAEFHTIGKSPQVELFLKELNDVNHNLKAIEKHDFFDRQQNRILYQSIETFLNQYETSAEQLVDTFQKRGFQDHGIEGQLRAAIHSVEDSEFPLNRVTMLMLRRHEKDFFLRKNLKYQAKFNATISDFLSEIDTTNSDYSKEEILASVNRYNKLFNQIVKVEEEIGLDESVGLRGDIQSINQQMGSFLLELLSRVKKRNEVVASQSVLMLFILLIIQVLIGAVLIVFYANLLTKAIKEIKSSIVSLANGFFPEQLIIRTKDEISDAKEALNDLVERVKTAVGFAEDLGRGKTDIQYDTKYKEDVLAKAIIKMQKQLAKASKQQHEINWMNEGLARFAEILKDENTKLEDLTDDIIAQMVKYLGANQGALFILQGDKLIRSATYAYGKKKYLDGSLNIGQGLVGQCVLEKQYIHMTDIPDDYIKITSGLGAATARNLLLLPLKRNEEVVGVMELASFTPFSELHIEFSNRVSENIANIVLNKQREEHTFILLKESEEKAARLASHEEELRQNAEELQATQEEMARQKEEMHQKILKLEKSIDLKTKGQRIDQNGKESKNDRQLQKTY